MRERPEPDPGDAGRDALAAARELTSGESALAGVLGDLERTLAEPTAPAERGRLERELLALIAIAGVVGGAHRIDDVVAFTADRALAAVDAASLSISRWEAEGQVLRTLVNAGELGAGEHHRPTDEVYRLEDDDALRQLIERGQDYRMSLGDDDVHPLEHELLVRLGKQHCAGVGIRFASRPWGELWATRRADQPPFDDADVRFLHTVTGLIAAAAGRADVFARMAELAYRDPLTGVANRRALEERLENALERALLANDDLSVLLCDLDGLKEVNDVRGHQAGDAAIARVASALQEAAGNALVARIGGDEFCVLLEGRSAEDAQQVGEELLERLRCGPDVPLSASCGVASVGDGIRRAGDLLRAADAAQYTAKRAGRGRVSIADAPGDATWKATRTQRRAVRGLRSSATDVGALLDAALRVLDAPGAAGIGAGDRLEAVALAVGDAIDATAVAVSRHEAGAAQITTWFSLDRRSGRGFGERFGVSGADFPAADYPQSVELMTRGGTALVRADDEAADPAERAMLHSYGMDAVLCAGVPDGDGDGVGWLVEVFSDGRTAAPADVEAALRLLAAEAVRPRPRPPTSGR